MGTVTIEFEDKDLDYTVRVLRQRPHAEVDHLIEKIKQQVTQQALLRNANASKDFTEDLPGD